MTRTHGYGIPSFRQKGSEELYSANHMGILSMDEKEIGQLGAKAREALMADQHGLFEVIKAKAETMARLEAERLFAGLIHQFQQDL